MAIVLKGVYNQMLAKIGGNHNENVNWYLHKRARTIRRYPFFRELAFAIWAGGKSAESATSFLKRARKHGFGDYSTFAKIKKNKLNTFMVKVHGSPVPKKAKKMWRTIHNIAIELKSLPNEQIFRNIYFSGKVKSKLLDKEDINNLRMRGIDFIGKANSHFIIRNIGGEAIKQDIWVDRFLEVAKMSFEKLENQVQKMKIPEGKFDVVLWTYCKDRLTKDTYKDHFKQLFANT